MPHSANSSNIVGLVSMLLFLSCAGCGPTNNKPSDIESKAVPKISFAGQEWTLIGPTNDRGNITLMMAANEYTNGEDGKRLLELDSSADPSKTLYSRILHVQTRVNDRWVHNGPAADWLHSGERGESNYLNGELHGTYRRWWPNGTKWIESEYVNGEEVSVTSWDESGRED